MQRKGICKSRLLRHLFEHRRRGSFRIAVGRGVPLHEARTVGNKSLLHQGEVLLEYFARGVSILFQGAQSL